MKTLIFTLSMPGNSSWNGRWSGEDSLYAIVRSVKGTTALALAGKCFSHNFGDGWRASVSVRTPVDSADTRKTRKNTRGFCGYDWMVLDILDHGYIGDVKKEAQPCVA